MNNKNMVIRLNKLFDFFGIQGHYRYKFLTKFFNGDKPVYPTFGLKSDRLIFFDDALNFVENELKNGKIGKEKLQSVLSELSEKINQNQE